MPNIDSDTKVTLTVTQLFLGICVLLGGAWGILQLTTSGVRDDVSVIRQSVQALQLADKDGSRRVGETELKLVNEIGLLRTSIASLDGKISPLVSRLDFFDKSIYTLTGQLDDIKKQLATRQAAFNDPRSIQTFSASLKNLGFDDQKIVIVPWEGNSSAPIKFPQ
jgi:hypothetical protein